ncbi:Intraflagellar Transport Protein 72/74 [Thraustotheca clavata]|uniref:Intraflagellar Transport Protein 72/74 n=1 Tax=Thraustotheca clavata TaxID=74557 RepID=A0A1V9ZER6_9STRA|nr:Intraflagellar Transport Protein 72/74 [Thraustotheca clavata]
MSKFVKVTPEPQPSHCAKYPIRWAIFPAIVSMIMLINLITMPMKAYITEDLPWTNIPASTTFTNFSEFNATTLTLYQRLYNQNTLPSGVSYYEDNLNKVSRKLLDIPMVVPVEKCTESVLLGLPGVAFYGPAMVDLICAFASTNRSVNNSYNWNGRGTCLEEYYFGIKWISKCIWLTSGNGLDTTKDNRKLFTITYAVARYPSKFWSCIGFIYRVLYTGLVSYILWVSYYKHCYNLRTTLSTYGHRMNLGKDNWSYCIVIGDPTAMVLTNSRVALAFTIDICVSYSSSSLAVTRASQIEDITAMLSAFLYLSRGVWRTVWFPYLSLSIMSTVLKKFKREHQFTEVDPTIIVFVIGAYAGALSYCSANIPLFINFFHIAQRLLVPDSQQNERHEEILPFSTYVIVFLTMPLIYGFTVSFFTKRKFAPKNMSKYRSQSYNSVKMRAIISLHQLCSLSPQCTKLGGTLYSLFASEPKYKQTPTINFCGVDVFVLCYYNGTLQCQIRLCLLSTLDRNLNDPHLSIVDSNTPSKFTFHTLASDATHQAKYKLNRSTIGTRPGTGQRPGTGSQPLGALNARPGTGQRSALQSSGRPLTSRLGTGQVPATPGQSAGYGVSLNTEVQVTDRPVTQQGMMGMRIGTAGPGRQVQDASYFTGKLHQKTSELMAEIEKINKEIEQDAKDKSQYAQLEKKYEQLAVEVRDLEGQLADYNLAMDKLRSATDPAEIRQVQEQLHNRNMKEAEEVDRIFIMRQDEERTTKHLENEIHNIHLKQEDKINQLAPNKLEKYRALLDENHHAEAELEAKSQELEMLIQAIRAKEEELSMDKYREEYDHLENQAMRLKKEGKMIQDDLATAQMDPAEARNMLLARVKDDKTKMEQVEKQIASIEEENAGLKKALSEVKSELEERKNEGPDSNASQKYDMLYQRDQEMTIFMESFEEKKTKELENQRQSQAMIIRLLEHISIGLNRQDKMPSASKVEEMKSDLTFKERQLESAQTTKARLSMELAKRQAELEKVNTLDAKISVELSSLNSKMETMESDMEGFKNIDEMKDTHANTKQLLLRYKQQYIRRRDAMKSQVILLSNQYENIKHQLASNDTAKTLDSLEQKLRHHEQNIYHLKEFIDTKTREVEYEHVKQDCLKLLTELNTYRIKAQGVAQSSVGYHELLRISGENDKQKVWRSAAKFELILWTQSTDKTTYLTKLQKKIASLKKKTPTSETPAVVAVPAVPVAPTITPVTNPNPTAVAIQYTQQLLMQQQALLKRNEQQQAQQQAQQQQQQNRINMMNMAAQQNLVAQQAVAAAQQSIPVPTPAVAVATPAQTTGTNSVAATTLQQQPAVLIALQQQFQQQKQAMTSAQHNEMQRLRQTQLLQQQQINSAHIQQNTPLETRRIQMKQLQEQHNLARNKLTQEHKARQAQLLRTQQTQFNAQKQALAMNNSMATTAGIPAQPTLPISTPAAPSTLKSGINLTAATTQISPAQVAAAQTAQAAQRNQSRQLATNAPTGHTTTDTAIKPAPAVAAATPTTGDPLTYADKLKQMKTKYWDDLIVVHNEFTNLAEKKPASDSAQALQQQERIKHFLQNLKRILSLLSQDPSKTTSNNRNDLDRVEQHIQRQVIPIMQRVKADRLKKEVEEKKATEKANTAALQAQIVEKQRLEKMEADRKLQLQIEEKQRVQKQQEDKRKQEVAEKQRQLELEEKARQETTRKEAELARQREQLEAAKAAAKPKTPVRNLMEAQKKIQEEMTKIRTQHQLLLQQKALAKTLPAQQKVAHEIHLLQQRMNTLNQHNQQLILQAKLSEEVKLKTEPTTDATASSIATPGENGFGSVIPKAATGMTAAESLLTAITTYAKEKPQILQDAAPKFLDISLSIGAKLSTAFPLKAYITEDLPWTHFPTIPSYANFSQFNATTLALYQRNYNRYSLPPNSTYYEDNVRKVQVTRLILDIQEPIPLEKCNAKLLVGLPGVMFYGPPMVDILCTFVSMNKSLINKSEWHGRGTCIEQLYCGVKQAAQCFWLTDCDDISDTKSNSNLFTITTAVGRYPTAFWTYTKFIYRLCCTFLVLYILWINYYKNCLHLKKILEKFGHRTNMRNGNWHYVIMIGDPTPIVLTHPLVAFAFVLDILTSDSSNTLAVLRSSQTDDIIAMLSALFYLSRVWFSYLSISLASFVLKRKRLEHHFGNIDLTLAVIFAAIIGGGMSYCSGNTLFTVELFQNAQSCLIPQNLQNELVEGVPTTSIYFIAGALWPLVYSFFLAHMRHNHKHRISPIVRQDTIYSSLWFNPLKTRVILSIEKLFFSHPAAEEFGGNIYRLFLHQPRYQQYPAISLCGVDCFICCYQNGVLKTRIRLSLLETIDRNLNDPVHAITESNVLSQFTFNSVEVNEPRGKSQIHRSKISSAWCF